MNPETRWQCVKCGMRSDLHFEHGHKQYGLPFCDGQMVQVPRCIVKDGFPCEEMPRFGLNDFRGRYED